MSLVVRIIIGLGILGIVGFIVLLTLALCKAAGDADRDIERLHKQREREKVDSHKWCDDECLHCPENDWCKFSEVNYK